MQGRAANYWILWFYTTFFNFISHIRYKVGTRSSGNSLDLCTFKSMTKLLISAKVPRTWMESGKLPSYLPDMINGLPDERSGIWDGNSCKEEQRRSTTYHYAIRNWNIQFLLIKETNRNIQSPPSEIDTNINNPQ